MERDDGARQALLWANADRVAAGVFALEIKPLSGEQSFEPVNQNGSERGWRPFVHFFPNRLKDIEIISGKEFSPVITDTFVLMPNPRVCDLNKAYRVEFKATVVTPQP